MTLSDISILTEIQKQMISLLSIQRFLVDGESNDNFQFLWIKSSFNSLLVVFFEWRTIVNLTLSI